MMGKRGRGKRMMTGEGEEKENDEEKGWREGNGEERGYREGEWLRVGKGKRKMVGHELIT